MFTVDRTHDMWKTSFFKKTVRDGFEKFRGQFREADLPPGIPKTSAHLSDYPRHRWKAKSVRYVQICHATPMRVGRPTLMLHPCPRYLHKTKEKHPWKRVLNNYKNTSGYLKQKINNYFLVFSLTVYWNATSTILMNGTHAFTREFLPRLSHKYFQTPRKFSFNSDIFFWPE